MLIRGAEVDGVTGADVRIDGGLITAVGARLGREPGEPVVDARGGALIPGLHDHHVHLRAWAASRSSVSLAAVRDPADLDRRVREAAGAAGATEAAGAWLRGVGWHEGTGGELDRHRLDALTGDRPARIQHRTGALWVLNSAAVALTGAAGASHAGIERDATGEPTGRLWRADDWLRDRTAPARDPFPEALAALAADAAAYGVTRWTDATPGRTQAETDTLAAAHRRAGSPALVLMTPPGVVVPPGAARGPHKIVLDDATLPTPEALAATIADSHAAGSPVAVHCVTAEQLVTLVAALEEAGSVPGDRIEHAGIVPPGYASRVAALGLAVVTNPGFLADRGDAYLRDVPPPEVDWLYPVRSLLGAGVTVAAATDAPFGPADPWVAIAAAATRRAASGATLNPGERVAAATALGLFLVDPQASPRRIAPGQPGDLCLLHTPLATALAAPSSECVRTVLRE